MLSVKCSLLFKSFWCSLFKCNFTILKLLFNNTLPDGCMQYSVWYLFFPETFYRRKMNTNRVCWTMKSTVSRTSRSVMGFSYLCYLYLCAERPWWCPGRWAGPPAAAATGRNPPLIQIHFQQNPWNHSFKSLSVMDIFYLLPSPPPSILTELLRFFLFFFLISKICKISWLKSSNRSKEFTTISGTIWAFLDHLSVF